MASRPILDAFRGPGAAALPKVSAALVSLGVMATTCAALEIQGTVNTSDGVPIPGANVSILSAASSSRASKAAGRWCSPDCGKHSITDARGAYVLRDLEAGAEFTLSVEAKDYRQRLRTVMLDSSRRVSFTLPSSQATPDGSEFQFAGRVLRPDGKPAVGAVISREKNDPRIVGGAARVARRAIVGPVVAETQEFGLWTTTDEEGSFFVLSSTPTTQLAVTVDADGAAKGQAFQLLRGQKLNNCQLVAGASISGRVLKDARAVAGVTVGLMPAVLAGERAGAPHEATTDWDGRYVIEHVPPERGCLLFTRMDSLVETNLAAITQEIYTGRDGQTVEVAELNLHPAHELRGRLVFSDAPSSVPAMQVILSRIGAPDVQHVNVEEDNTFVLRGVPQESVSVALHTEGMNRLHGYRLSPQHFSLEYVQRAALCGRVDEDLDLTILLEPGEAPPIVTRPQLKARNLMIINQQQGGRIVRVAVPQPEHNPMLERQRELENQPLRGINPDVLLRLEKK